MPTWRTREVRVTEFDEWTALFRGYCDFYRWPTSDEHQALIWRWIHEDRFMTALVTIGTDELDNETGHLVGLAHLREWIRPLRGLTCGYLDDLFVDPAVRGSGVVESLFDEMDHLARARQWAIIRWTTADDNHRAHAAYNKIATRTSWVTYDMTIL
jgi:GNAT superfamily N-acetyltransferase